MVFPSKKKLHTAKSSQIRINFEIIVDNARTHSAVEYDVNLLGKKPGTICPYRTLEWVEGI